jgi:methyltransferase (TIGR00027 family)
VATSSIAEWVTAYRAAEAALPGDRSIYRDPDAQRFVRDVRLRALVARPWWARAGLALLDAATPGLAGQAFVRYRYFDELLGSMLEQGLDQVVVLGAGYDATSLRVLRASPDAKVYEVDQRETQARKRKRMAQVEPAALDHTIFVECDFARDSVADRLTAAGHAIDRPTLLSWLGVSWYLDRASVEATLADLASIAAPKSRIVFDYIHASVLSGAERARGVRLARRVVARQGEPWTFGLSPDRLREWAAGLGWSVAMNVPAAELRDRFQRSHAGRLRVAASWVNVVDAEREGQPAS